MFLTRVYLNPRRESTRELLSDTQRMHATVLTQFGPSSLSGPSRTLWRLDQPNETEMHLWIQSSTEPDVTALVEDHGWPKLENTVHSMDMSESFARITDGDILRIRLRGNTVRRRHNSEVSLRSVGEQVNWLSSRLTTNGMRLNSFPTILESGRRPFIRQGKSVPLFITDYEAEVTVEDSDKFREGVSSGIGRAKSYGCGLVLVSK